MRGCGLTLGCIGLVLGYIAAGTGIAATLVHLAHQAELTWRANSDLSKEKGPLARELARCQQIGAAAPNDEHCEAAWAESRRRFLDYGAEAKRVDVPTTNPIQGH
jgi:conjugative transfer region protein TrbK